MPPTCRASERPLRPRAPGRSGRCREAARRPSLARQALELELVLPHGRPVETGGGPPRGRRDRPARGPGGGPAARAVGGRSGAAVGAEGRAARRSGGARASPHAASAASNTSGTTRVLLGMDPPWAGHAPTAGGGRRRRRQGRSGGFTDWCLVYAEGNAKKRTPTATMRMPAREMATSAPRTATLAGAMGIFS